MRQTLKDEIVIMQDPHPEQPKIQVKQPRDTTRISQIKKEIDVKSKVHPIRLGTQDTPNIGVYTSDQNILSYLSGTTYTVKDIKDTKNTNLSLTNQIDQSVADNKMQIIYNLKNEKISNSTSENIKNEKWDKCINQNSN